MNLHASMTPQDRLRNLRKEIAAVEREIAADARRAKQVPEPTGAHPVVRFNLRTGKSLYFYAAIKAKGRWWTTGPSCPTEGYTWTQLIEFANGARITTITEGDE